jgi:hypothetical protein
LAELASAFPSSGVGINHIMHHLHPLDQGQC